MIRRVGYQPLLAVIVVTVVLYVRLTWLQGSSPFEVFLLLNIVLATLLRTPATVTSILTGLLAAHAVMVIEGAVPRRYGTMLGVYGALSGILLLLNHRWHSARGRAEAQRLEHDRQRERLLAQAQAANRAKDQLLANVSHELRTPLNAISGWATMIGNGMLHSAEDLERAAAVIGRNVRALSTLVDELLDVSMAFEGRVRVDLAPLDVAPLIHDVVESLAPEAAARGVALIADVRSDVQTVEADRQRLEQVLRSLVSNAVKFSHPGGRVRIQAAVRDGRLTIDITDNGIGIDPAFLPLVFDRFSQGDPSTTRVHGGIGLGLTIARHLVEQMSGEIAASSPGANQGATFTVTFPLLASPR